MSVDSAIRTLEDSGVQNSAGAAIEEYGVSQMARNGMGHAWQSDFVRSAVRGNNVGAAELQLGSPMVNNGMEFSGAFADKTKTMIAENQVQTMGNASIQGQGISDNAQSAAQGVVIANNQAQDNMQLQYDMNLANLESQKKSWWEETLGVVNSLAPFAGGIGSLANLIPGGGGNSNAGGGMTMPSGYKADGQWKWK